MNSIRITFTKTPLLVRVVSLYILCSLPVISAQEAYAYKMPESINTVRPQIKRLATTGIEESTDAISGDPIRIYSPKIGIDLPVDEGKYNARNKSWTLTDTVAHFASITSKPNNIDGNTVIYGHNTDLVFAKLSNVKTGDSIYVKTDNGHTFHYVFSSDLNVSPEESSVFDFHPLTPRLTVITCDGLWSESRRILFFDFKEVK